MERPRGALGRLIGTLLFAGIGAVTPVPVEVEDARERRGAAVGERDRERDPDDDIVDETVELMASADTPEQAAHVLAIALELMTPMDATRAAATIALQPAAATRRALAEALGWVFPLVGDDVVLEHLAGDADPDVGFAVARAAHARRPSLGDELLGRLVADPDPRVAHTARFALHT